jgi:hypothetical protein
MSKILSRSVLGLLVAAMLGVFAATPALAYGAENYQIGFAGTAVAPGTGSGFGFWGWCTFGGGTTFNGSGLATSGTTGDCNYALYIHTSSGGGVTCEQRIDATSWTIQQGSVVPVPTFFATGTATVNPSSAAVCFALFLGVFPPTFSSFDTLIPAAPGHYNLGTFGTLKGELQIQVTAIP